MQANNDLRARAAAWLARLSRAASALTRLQMASIAGLLLVLCAGCLLALRGRTPETVKVLGAGGGKGRARAEVSMLTVHVAGAVASPGLYQVAEGSRVADALRKAGGPAPDAVLDNLNLAARLKDGEKIMVPRSPPNGEAPGVSSGPTAGGELVNINTADEAELETLPGVGPATARKIIEYREKNGQFSSVEELDEVPGIGPSRLESLRELVTI